MQILRFIGVEVQFWGTFLVYRAIKVWNSFESFHFALFRRNLLSLVWASAGMMIEGSYG